MDKVTIRTRPVDKDVFWVGQLVGALWRNMAHAIKVHVPRDQCSLSKSDSAYCGHIDVVFEWDERRFYERPIGFPHLLHRRVYL